MKKECQMPQPKASSQRPMVSSGPDRPLDENKLFQNWKLDIRNWTFSRGFTLIELLISITIIMLVGTMIIVVFFSVLRGTNKSQVLISIRQNGNFALSQMSREIRQAEQAVCSLSSDSVQITSARDQSVTTYQCTPTNISSGSSFLLDETQVRPMECSFTCGIRPPLDIPSVTIRFSLTSAGDTSLPEKQLVSPTIFTTTVLLRNTPEE